MTIQPVKKKTIIFLLILATAISLLSWPVIKHMTITASKFQLTEDYPSSDTVGKTVYYEIDRAERDNLALEDGGGLSGADQNYFVIEGWAGVEGESIEIFNTTVLLKKDDGSVCYKLRGAMNQREDLADYNGSGDSYQSGGFVCRIDSRQMDPGNYQVCILYGNDGNDFVIYTDTYIEVN